MNDYKQIDPINLPHIERLKNDQCEKCKKRHGLNQIQIIKYDQVHFFVNKSFIHNNKSDSRGKFVFEIIKYKHGFNI